MEFNIEVLGFLAGTLTTASFLPQVFKVWRTKKVEDLSLTMYVTMLLGVSLWFLFGYYINSISIMIVNSVTAVLVFFVIYYKIRFSKK